MKEYDLIAIGSGSAMGIVDTMIQQNPNLKVAVIDKDEPGGICLTRGCIPSKILTYSADMVRTVEKAKEFGIEAKIEKIDFQKVMERMRNAIYPDIKQIGEGLSHSENVDYYQDIAEFIAPYKLKVANETVTSKLIILGAGSKPKIPPVKDLEDVGYHTSDTILKIDRLPKSMAIIGGGYIAAEYGHFFSAMGSDVTIVGRNPQFLPEEEPEVSALAKRELQKYVKILTNHEVRSAEELSANRKKLAAVNRRNGEEVEVTAEEILVAAGRGPNTDILHPEKGGIEVDKEGWIIVDEYLETSQPNIWSLGDANGKHLFKHVANYESTLVYYNAILKRKLKVDYHAIPHAVFTHPEIASVGLREKEAREKYGDDKVLIGFHRYQDTGKGDAMGVKDYFAKIIVGRETLKILGAHIIGPQASVLIQEVINLMYTPEQSAKPIISGMHIHPALSEVVDRAFRSLMPPEHYHHIIDHHYRLPTD